MHPLFENTESLETSDIENKLTQLNRKYWQTSNPQLQQQIVMLIDGYKLELESRRAKEKLVQQSQENGDNNLDNLIKVS